MSHAILVEHRRIQPATGLRQSAPGRQLQDSTHGAPGLAVEVQGGQQRCLRPQPSAQTIDEIARQFPQQRIEGFVDELRFIEQLAATPRILQLVERFADPLQIRLWRHAAAVRQRFLSRSSSSLRVRAFSRRLPRMALVTVELFCFWTPRIIMQK